VAGCPVSVDAVLRSGVLVIEYGAGLSCLLWWKFVVVEKSLLRCSITRICSQREIELAEGVEDC
jgi:hypothetical protein